MSITAYPLSWPMGWKRTPEASRQFGRFSKAAQRSGASYTSRRDVTVTEATGRLLIELQMMGVDREDSVLSTNLQLRLDGLPKSNQGEPRDPGAAVYWRDPFNGQPRSMAIDRYTQVAQNIAALAATLEAMRAIERHGGAAVLERAYTGFSALPAPIVAGMHRPWRDVLELQDVARPTLDEVQRSYRRLASLHHPDRGGSADRMAEINRAYLEAQDAVVKGGAQ